MIMKKITIDDWQGRDPSDCSEVFNDSPDKTSDKQFFIGMAILLIVIIGGFYFMGKIL